MARGKGYKNILWVGIFARVSVGKQTLYFLPDHLLVHDVARRAVGAVDYSSLSLQASNTRFTETVLVPPDAIIVDRVWAHMKKSGEPDLRFKYNPEIPIVTYEQVRFQSTSGLNEEFHFSRQGVGAAISTAVNQLAQALAEHPVETAYLRCICSKCSNPIEFPAEGVGISVNCPHCGAETVLVVSNVEPKSQATEEEKRLKDRARELEVEERRLKEQIANRESSLEMEANATKRETWPPLDQQIKPPPRKPKVITIASAPASEK